MLIRTFAKIKEKASFRKSYALLLLGLFLFYYNNINYNYNNKQTKMMKLSWLRMVELVEGGSVVIEFFYLLVEVFVDHYVFNKLFKYIDVLILRPQPLQKFMKLLWISFMNSLMQFTFKKIYLLKIFIILINKLLI